MKIFRVLNVKALLIPIRIYTYKHPFLWRIAFKLPAVIDNAIKVNIELRRSCSFTYNGYPHHKLLRSSDNIVLIHSMLK